MSSVKKIKDKLSDPINQAVIILTGCLFFQIFSLLLTANAVPENNTGPWIVAGASTLFYAFVNAVVSLQGEQIGTYFTRAVSGYFLMLLGSAAMAYAFAGFSAAGSASIRWIFIMITFSYFIFITIAFFMRKIINYAQRQDTEHRS